MPKRLIVCCDGTWNDLEMRYITNVGLTAQALESVGADGVPQVLYYDDGVGAAEAGLGRTISGAFGVGLRRNMFEAYRFLCVNYEDGDEICLFGFSRGAYTVRTLAGMIGRCGLVRRKHLAQIPKAVDHYRAATPNDEGAQAKAATFKRRYAAPARVRLLGCWDTVGALGIPNKIPWLPIDDWFRSQYEFHDTTLGAHIDLALHAVAIDEHRKEFDATLMERPSGGSVVLEQMWFPGDHGSVGGGTWEKRGLSNAALKWMLGAAREHGVALGYDLSVLHDQAIDDPTVYYDESGGLIYGHHERTVKATWGAIHDSAKQRYFELQRRGQRRFLRHADYAYPAPNLVAKFGQQLAAWTPSGTAYQAKQPPARAKRLAPGQSADALVIASEPSNASRITLGAGEYYRLSVRTLQVWKDGDLDPCGISGWSRSAAWQDGEQHDFNAVVKAMIKSAEDDRHLPSADWFQLLYRVGSSPWSALPATASGYGQSSFDHQFQAPASGELRFAANDAQRVLFSNRYKNNQGWVWVRVERLA